MTKLNAIMGSSVVVSIMAVSILVGGFTLGSAVADDGEETELIAILFDSVGNDAGEAKYEAEEDKSELKIEIKDFVSNDVFVVLSEDTQIGMIATDSEGKGELKFEPSPVMINNGTSITVENSTGTVLSGTFEFDSDKDDEEDDEE